MIHHHVWRLRNQHRRLDRALRDELRKPNPDAMRVQDLKRRKLRVKDDLFLAEAGLYSAAAPAGFSRA